MVAISRDVPSSGGSVGARTAVPLAKCTVTIGYAAAALALAAGWLANRQGALVDPLTGAGYWLGVTGASLMATLLLYPVRKRFRFMRVLGATRYWFRMHMTFGVLGPVLVLYHANFHLGSVNSNVALFCTLLVATSGLVGRYLYAKIHSDLDGHKTSLRELAERAQVSAEQRAHVATLVPELLERLRTFDATVLEPPHGLLAALALPAKLAVVTRIEAASLKRLARRELRRRAGASETIAAQRVRLGRAVGRFIDEHLRRVRRVAGFNSYERMFALWHLFHLPFFYMLVLTAIVHVVAVHMY